MSTSASGARSRRPRSSSQPGGAITAEQAITSAAIANAEPSERDMRAKRPPVLSFLLRLDTARRIFRVITLLALDLVGVGLAIFTALIVKAAALDALSVSAAVAETRHLVAIAYLITVLLFWRSAMYADRGSRPGLTRIVACLFQVGLLLALLAIVQGDGFSSYYIFYASFAFAVIYVAAIRYLYEQASGILLRAAGYRRRAVLAGGGEHLRDVARALRDSPRAPTPIEIVGYFSPDLLPGSSSNGAPAGGSSNGAPAGGSSNGASVGGSSNGASVGGPSDGLSMDGMPSLGGLDRLEDVLGEMRIDELIIADPEFPADQAVELVDSCHRHGVRVRIAPSTMELLVQRAEFVPGESVPLFELGPPVFEGIDFAVKRTFDVVCATIALVLMSPLLAAIALAVKLSSRGPVIFGSVRPGIGQLPFTCLKFRTMHTDAEQRQADLESSNEASGALFKIKDDPRLTRVGGFLRRFSLDELPQLVNVLRGEMSLVGPRPLPLRDHELLEDWHRKRYLVLPGMTGLWQVSGRSELDFDDLVRLDFVYLERWSLALDLAILAKTIPAVISRRGAY